MAQDLFGSIEISHLWELVKNQPELIKTVEGKDGKQHKYVSIYVNARQTPSQFGHTHYVKVACKKDNRIEGINYYIGDCKPNDRQASAPQEEEPPF